MRPIASDDDDPWVRVVIVNFNSGQLLQTCIDHLEAQRMAAFEVIVVDNASCDGSLEALSLPDRRFRTLSAGGNLGFAAANNLGARGCCAPWLATLNPDAFADPDWLANLRSATERYPGIAMFGSTQIDAADPSRLDGCGDILSGYGIPWRGGFGHSVSVLPADGEPFAPCAAAALYRRDAFESVGGFDERFFCYLEDVDLGFRLRLLGERCMQIATARVYHVGSATTGRASHFTLFHSYRNRVWLVFKNMPLVVLAPLLVLHFAATLYLLVRTRHLKETGPCLAGLWAGALGLPSVLPERFRVQRVRTVSSGRVIRALTWPISKLKSRAIDLRPR